MPAALPSILTGKAPGHKPGQIVPTSGIYAVTRDGHHPTGHEVTCVAGEEFPPCNGLGHHPRFKLVRPARHRSLGLQI